MRKENIGKVVYARPITQEEFEKIKALNDAKEGYDLLSQSYVPISKSIYELRMSLHKDFRIHAKKEASNIVYQMVSILLERDNFIMC